MTASTAMTYANCYRILRVRSGCEWSELRLAYRRRVRECHPDRMGERGRAPGNDDEFKQVVLAYRMLARFRLRHGELPPPWLVVDDARVTSRPATAARPAPTRDDAATATGRMRWRPPRLHVALFATFVSSVCAAALLDRFDGAEDGVMLAGNGELAVGMDPQSVVEIQGVPHYTEGSVWFYGESGVIFDDGCVVGWENQPPFPLRTLVSANWSAGTSARDDDAGCAKRN